MDTPIFASLEGLSGLGRREGFDMRPTLLRVLTDLYVQKLTHTPDEERRYTELALRLLDSVDVPTRAVIAARLARHMSPPMRVIRRLAEYLPSAAEMLCAEPRHEGSAESVPPALGPSSAAEPDRIAPPREAKTGRGTASPALNQAMAADLNEQFFAAGAVERRLILRNLDIAIPLSTGHAVIARDPAIAQRLEAAALSRNRDEFARQLAQALHISRKQASRVTADPLGEPVVVAARALGVPREMTYRILMFVNPTFGHSVERVHALARLYGEISQQSAEHMVLIWQALERDKKAAAHRPLLWDDETRSRPRAPAAVTAPRAPAIPIGNPGRHAS